MNYYNEFDPKTAAWLRELIADGLIPQGHVDERSITEVKPRDLAGFAQCHFFAGIGGWSEALKLARWPEDRPVWTGSCPCQPFSLAGKQKGIADERHLWPVWFSLIRECRPPTLIGEQVASPLAIRWLDGVCDDLEGQGYACGAAVLPAACVGAPHLRHRVFWVADSQYSQRWPKHLHKSDGCDRPDGGREEAHCEPGTRCKVFGAADAKERGQRTNGSAPRKPGHVEQREQACWLATPAARDWRDGRASQKTMDHNSRPLNEQVVNLAGWCSPTAQDHSRGVRPPRTQDTGIPLSQQVSGLTPYGTHAGTENPAGLALNPRFSLWLMGYPTSWEAAGLRALRSFKAQATPSYRKSPRSSPAPSLNACKLVAAKIIRDANEDRRHIRKLLKLGMSKPQIAKAMGLPEDAPPLQE